MSVRLMAKFNVETSIMYTIVGIHGAVVAVYSKINSVLVRLCNDFIPYLDLLINFNNFVL